LNLTLSVIVLKTLFITGVATLFLPLFSAISIFQAIIIGLAMSFFTYAADLILLPRVTILAATAADVIIITLVLWAGVRFFVGIGLSVPESLLITAITTYGEWFLHRYLRVNVNARPD